MALFGGSRPKVDWSKAGTFLTRGTDGLDRRRDEEKALLALQQRTMQEDRLRAALSPADGPMGSGTGAVPNIQQQMAALDEARLLNPEVADKFAPLVQGRRMAEMTANMPIEQRLAIELNPTSAGDAFSSQFKDMPLAEGTIRTRGNQAIIGAPKADRFEDRYGVFNPVTGTVNYSAQRGPTRGEELDVAKLGQNDRQFYDNLGLEREKIEAQRGASAQDRETKLRQEFLGLPDVKAFNEVAASYGAIQSAAENPTAAGDLSLIFAYMKMLDPGSAVREAEFANAQNAAGVPDQIRNAWNNALRGERLNPNQRNDFIGQAGKLYTARKSRYDQLYGEYQGLANSYGANPGRVTGAADRPAQSGQSQADPATAAAALQILRQRGRL